MKYLTKMEGYVIESANNHGFHAPASYAETKEMVKGLIGWQSYLSLEY